MQCCIYENDNVHDNNTNCTVCTLKWTYQYVTNISKYIYHVFYEMKRSGISTFKLFAYAQLNIALLYIYLFLLFCFFVSFMTLITERLTTVPMCHQLTRNYRWFYTYSFPKNYTWTYNATPIALRMLYGFY